MSHDRDIPWDEMTEKIEIQKTIRLLEATRELLTPESRWNQQYFFADWMGDYASFESLKPTNFCLLGALIKTSRVGWKKVYEYNTVHVTQWNDAPERTHADVLAVLDRAIELERAKL